MSRRNRDEKRVVEEEEGRRDNGLGIVGTMRWGKGREKRRGIFGEEKMDTKRWRKE